MLEHTANAATEPLGGVVVVGAGGFVGSAICTRLAAEKVPHLALTRKDIDLLEPEAATKLQRMLRPGDAVVFVSALAPTRNNSMLIDNLRMAETICAAVAAGQLAQLVYISSDAVYADDANPVTERSCQQPSSLHGMMHARARGHAANGAQAAARHPAADPDLWREAIRTTAMARTVSAGLPPRARRSRCSAKGEEKRDHVHIDDVAHVGERGAAPPQSRSAQHCNRQLRLVPARRRDGSRACPSSRLRFAARRGKTRLPTVISTSPTASRRFRNSITCRYPRALSTSPKRVHERCARRSISLPSFRAESATSMPRAEAKTDEIIAISRQYGELYFDGPRKYGYGGYRYDGRWIPVAEDMVEALRSQARRPRSRCRLRQRVFWSRI